MASIKISPRSHDAVSSIDAGRHSARGLDVLLRMDVPSWNHSPKKSQEKDETTRKQGGIKCDGQQTGKKSKEAHFLFTPHFAGHHSPSIQTVSIIAPLQEMVRGLTDCLIGVLVIWTRVRSAYLNRCPSALRMLAMGIFSRAHSGILPPGEKLSFSYHRLSEDRRESGESSSKTIPWRANHCSSDHFTT